jgi:transcriptional regulator with XRE-family HTH domain
VNKPYVSEALEFRQVEYGWTQRRMAKALGITGPHYNEILQGYRALPYRAACKAFEIGVPAEILLNAKSIEPKRAQVYGSGRRRSAKSIHKGQSK